ncbi:MAG: hypothetical protein GY768_00770 [Planctomycetaceae bacterium]|nr:hypothetical protein [Planctomycetaceae bacterium]
MDLIRRFVSAVRASIWPQEGNGIIIPADDTADNRYLIAFPRFRFTFHPMISFTKWLDVFPPTDETDRRHGGLQTVLINRFSSSPRLQEDS